MAVSYNLTYDGLKSLAADPDSALEQLIDLEMRLQTQQEGYEKLEDEFEAFRDYVDSVDDSIIAAFAAQRKMT